MSFAFTITPGLMAQGVAFSLVMGLLGGFLPLACAFGAALAEAGVMLSPPGARLGTRHCRAPRHPAGLRPGGPAAFP
ncbi:MAG TPA: hypothetical protein DHV93_09845 [Holophagaceae bacterium]|nr:hypothetical protein [Holophagaceae bacterium]